MRGPILILGAGGQVGQALSSGGVARFVALKRADCDITKPEDVNMAVRRFAPRAVINCAVYRDVDRAETERDAAFLTNAYGPEVIAKACRDADVPLVHISSDYAERAECWFGATKLAGESAVRAIWDRHVIIRTSWLFGRHGRNFLKTILAKAKAGETLRVVNDQIGTPTHTDDLAHAIFEATHHLVEAQVSGTYDFAGPDPCSWFDFAEEIVQAAGLTIPVTPISTAQSGARARRPAYSALDSTTFAKTFGVRAARREQRIAETLAALSA